uniref:GTP 3',8-cyclase n=1 Tax=Trichuris muris TaxID=70415 RepID=A0A5S6QBT2_TRIMR
MGCLRLKSMVCYGYAVPAAGVSLGRRILQEMPAKNRFVESQVARHLSAQRTSQSLRDSFGRFHNYLRISLTDRCNLRCKYCMPMNGVTCYSPDQLLSQSEIFALTSLFSKLGVTKVRLTGGEPTVRTDLMDIVGSLSRISGLKKLGLTSNGILLRKMLPKLKERGLTHLNLSLDTLIEPKFQLITGSNGWKHVWKTIEMAERLYPVIKINCVVIRGYNEEELCDFVELTRNRSLDVRFIEYMPFNGNKWEYSKMVSYLEMMQTIQRQFGDLMKLENNLNDTSKGYQVPGFRGRIGFITSMSQHFCGSCSRLRLTADGCLKVCLHGNSEVSLRDAVRSGASEEALIELINKAILSKQEHHAGMFRLAEQSNRPMVQIGG